VTVVSSIHMRYASTSSASESITFNISLNFPGNQKNLDVCPNYEIITVYMTQKCHALFADLSVIGLIF